MIFKTLEEAAKFYKHYSKLAGFSTKIKNMTRDGDKIKNQLIVCTREGRWKSKISPTLKINPSAGLNCLARLYVHIMKDVGLWTISKVVLNHSHPCCPDRAEMLKQHRELSMFVRRTIETHKEAGIRPSKIYQSFVATAGSHRELSFIEKDVRNYITREARNIFEEDDAKEFGKNWNDFITKYGLEGNKWLSENRERIRCCRFSHRNTLCNKISNRGLVSTRVYPQEVQGSSSTIQRFLTRHSTSFWSRTTQYHERGGTHIKSSQDEPLLEPRSKRFDELLFRSYNICEFASESEELTGILHRAFDKVMAETQEYQERSKEKSLLSHEEVTLSEVNDLQIPPRVKTRGRPKNRLGSNLEKKISNATKKKKKTAPSELNLLDCGSSIQSSSTLYDALDMHFPRENYRSFSFY
ncbi:hypothetical protein Ahy_B02g058896 [Arachis hypogaea]|uniref:FAR1 domain-containing protein n=1 Tax=Arachis hypogaea TaxID=3818 RepID=A0A445AFP2_ARAHY|nr:hypothetical protein Ahy_B02g058896 [Arachis hypogaea]